MKKTLLIFISLFSLLSLKSQTALDSLVFSKVNEYRKSKNIQVCNFDTICQKECKVQANYLTKNSKIGHSNPEGNSKLRYTNAGGQINANTAEVCTNIKPINLKVDDSLVNEKLAEKIIEAWKNSELHNKAILEPRYKFIGVSVQVVTSSCGVNGYLNYQVYAVMFFSDIK